MELKNELSLRENFKEKTGLDFDEYYLKFYPKLTYTIERLNMNHIDAESIANEAFIRSLEKIEQYNPEYQFSTWLFNIGKHMAYKFLTDRAKEIPVDTTVNSDSEETAGFQYYLNTQIDETNHTESYEEIHKLKYNETLKEINNLPKKYKYIIEMCDIYGMSYNQIVDETGESLQTVKNRLHHGRKIIQKKLKTKFNYLVENY